MGILKKMKKNIAALMAVAMTMSFTSNIAIKANAQTSSIPEGKKIVGYFTDWTGMNVNDVQYDKLTHINYSFLIPMEDGNVRPFEQESKLRELITKAHANGVKVMISVGGWSYKNAELDPVFAKAASTDATREKLVDNIVQCVNTYNFDGADIDWEYPDPGTEADNYLKLMQGLNSKLKPNGKLLTAAVTSGTAINTPTENWYAKAITKDVFDLVDFLNLMVYDGGNGADHSPYIYAENSMKVWANKGLPKEKMVLGVPFYARPSWRGYNEIVASDSQAPNKDISGTDYYNGIDTIKKKTELALQMGSGVMIWELSQDTNDSTSLLSAIYSVVSGGSTGPVVSKPSAASLSHDNSDNDGNYNVTINVPANNNANSITIYENNKEIDTITLDGTTNKVITKSFTNKSAGTYKYNATTKNSAGVTYSNDITVTVKSGSTTPVTPAASGTKVVGYFTDWTGMNVNDVQYDKLTHINYSFLIPMEDGNVRPFEQDAKLRELLTKAHENNVKVLISVGGWSYKNAELDPVFAKATSTDETRNRLVDNIVKCVNDYGFDGADIDWEYPDPGTEADNYLKLMTGLNSKLKANGKLLTAAVTSGTAINTPTENWNAKAITKDIFDLVDFLNLMVYDGGNGADHSPYIYAENSMKVWAQKGLSKEKMVLGVPFYARPSWRGYNEIVASDSQAPNKDISGTDYYNGIDTIKKKTQLALQMGSGVMIWELSQDTNDDTSLLKAINDVTGPLHQGTTPDDKAKEDLNKDGKVDELDLSLLATLYNVQSTDSNYDASYDLNNDGIVDVFDMVAVASKIGGTTVDPVDPVEPVEPDKPTGETTWDASKQYVGGSEVLYNGVKYRAKWWTQNEVPGETAVWEKIS